MMKDRINGPLFLSGSSYDKPFVPGHVEQHPVPQLPRDKWFEQNGAAPTFKKKKKEKMCVSI
jgi:hypothetical protein